jgi:hypothetical protein
MATIAGAHREYEIRVIGPVRAEVLSRLGIVASVEPADTGCSPGSSCSGSSSSTCAGCPDAHRERRCSARPSSPNGSCSQYENSR